jgi:hypothetical protein
MSYFYFSYEGEALGGEAIVLAHDALEAIKVLDPDSKLEELTLDLVVAADGEPKVIHNWNGDY